MIEEKCNILSLSELKYFGFDVNALMEISISARDDRSQEKVPYDNI